MLEVRYGYGLKMVDLFLYIYDLYLILLHYRKFIYLYIYIYKDIYNFNVSFISHNQVKYHEMNLHAWIDIAIIKGIIGSWISKRVF